MSAPVMSMLSLSGALDPPPISAADLGGGMPPVSAARDGAGVSIGERMEDALCGTSKALLQWKVAMWRLG